MRIAGMTKGSGMIQPNMATTLGFVMTDAAIPRCRAAPHAARAPSKRSYNRITVDGDTSTNDTLLLLANGASGVRPDPKEMQESGRGADAGDGGSGAADRARWRRRAQAGHHRCQRRVQRRSRRRASRAPSPIRRW